MGLMLGMELNSPEMGKAVVSRLLERGILINRTHDTVLRFLPPYIVEKKHVDQVVRALDSALAEAATQTGRKSARPKKSARRSQH